MFAGNGSGDEMRTKLNVASEGIVRWDDNLYAAAYVDATHTKIYRTPAYTTEEGDAMEVVEEITIEASYANWNETWGFIGAGGKIYLWDGARRVVTFDIATMAIETTDDYAFDITTIACDADAYYIGENGTADPNVPLHVHRIPLTGSATEYTGDVSSEDALYWYYREHFVEYIYCAAGRVYISCGSNLGDTPELAYRHLAEIDPSTMTFVCRTTLTFVSSTSAGFATVGITDLVSDGTYVYILVFGYKLYKYAVGTLGSYLFMVNSGTGAVSLKPDGLMYYDAHIYRSVVYGKVYGNRLVYVYACSDLSGASNLSYSTLYHAVCDGTWLWQDLVQTDAEYRSLARTTFPPTAESYSETLFRWTGEDVVHSLPWWKFFRMCKVP
jgi:hypothetical protein